MTRGFELLDHPSEIGFRATGKTIEEAFEHAGQALFQVMTDIDALGRETTVAFTVESENLESLLFDFVDELIFIAESKNIVLRDFDITLETFPGTYKIEGTGYGEEIRDGMRLQDVKAPTYSDMRVEDRADKWVLEMYLDI